MTSLPRFSVHNPVLMNLFMVAILVGGVHAGLTIVHEMFPESRPQRVLISTAFPGATPSEVEKGITLKIEEQIKDVDGVEKITSSINEGSSAIFVELQSGFDEPDQAVNDIKAAIDTIPTEDFPEEALETSVAKFEPRWPVISVALSGDLSDRELKRYGENLKSELLTLPAVTDVVLSGTRKDEISIEVRPAKLVEFGLSFMDVARAVEHANLDLPGGQLRTEHSNVAVRTLGERQEGDTLGDIVIRNDHAGRVVRVRDVATVVDGFEDVDVAGRFQGKPSVNLTVYKTADQDAIDIAHKVRALVRGKLGQPFSRPLAERTLAKLGWRDPVQQVYDTARTNPVPAEVELAIHSDLSRFIESRLDLLKRNGFWGLVLVSLSLLMFLHWRVALWVMMGLLLAIAGSLICMKMIGQTLNLITMFGLIIVLGLLVDDAIIVAEHVYTKLEQGIDPKRAAVAGAEEVTWPVVCAITTTIVAFVPLMYIEGQMGDWIGVLPIIVCVALTVSLLEALSILPSHLAHGLRSAGPHASTETGSPIGARAAPFRAGLRHRATAALRRHYERLLRRALHGRYVTMAALSAILVVILGVVAGGHVPFVFMQKMDSETIVASLRMEVGTPFERTRRAASVVERAMLALPELRSVYTLLGTQLSDDGVMTSPRSNVAQLFLELSPSEQRNRDSAGINRELRSQTDSIPGVRRLKYTSIQGGPGGAPIRIEVSGDRVEDLATVAAEVKAHLREYAGVFDINDDFDAGRREVQIELFDSATALGLTTESLAVQVRSAFYGFEAQKIQRGREDVKVMVRYPPAYREHVYDVESMRLATPDGGLVPFTEVARLTEGTGYASINRINQRRTVGVTADVDDNVTSSDRVMALVAQRFPDWQGRYPGMTFAFGGQKLETRKSFSSIKTDFIAALLMIYTILVALFRNYIQPLIVMAVIPFGLVGAVVGHFVFGYPITILSMIGLVALTGIVVNDSMILVSFINRRLDTGVCLMDAVVDGCNSRMRPILLTSATTVLGIAPLLAERSFQARFLIPMGISIAGGLVFATVITLVAVPSLYLIAEDARRALTAVRHRAFGSTAAPHTA